MSSTYPQRSLRDMKNTATILIVLVILGGGYYLLNMNKPTENVAMEQKVSTPEAMVKEESLDNGETLMATGEVKEFTVEGSEFAFDMKEIMVKKGDTVKISFKNVGKFKHDWVVDEFDARTEIIEGGKTSEVTFVADQVGTFEYYCSVMEHRAQGMVGNLIVE